MDIRMPEMFGWHPHKDAGERQESSEPSPYVKGAVLTALILLVLAMAWMTGYYFTGYIEQLFK